MDGSGFSATRGVCGKRDGKLRKWGEIKVGVVVFKQG